MAELRGSFFTSLDALGPFGTNPLQPLQSKARPEFCMVLEGGVLNGTQKTSLLNVSMAAENNVRSIV